jgi:hypothetical protein
MECYHFVPALYFLSVLPGPHLFIAMDIGKNNTERFEYPALAQLGQKKSFSLYKSITKSS